MKQPGDYPPNLEGEQTDSGEIELAYALQNGQASDERLLHKLVERYAAEIYRLARVLLASREGGLRRSSEVWLAVASTFELAGAEAPRFWGQSSVRTWLFGLALRAIVPHMPDWLGWRRKHRAPVSPPDLAGPVLQANLSPHVCAQPTWQELDRLPLRLHRITVLRHLCGLSEAEIGLVVEARQGQVSARLAAAYARIRRRSSGKGCPEDLAEYLDQTLPERWSLPALTAAQLAYLKQSITASARQPKSRQSFLRPVMGVLWAGGLLIGLSALFFAFNRGDIRQLDSAFIPTATQGRVESGPGTSRRDRQAEDAPGARRFSDFIFSIEPGFSADGRFVVFTSTDPSLVTGDSNHAADIFVLDRQQLEVKRVNVSSAGEQAFGWSTSPSISADGRWVVFASTAGNLTSDSPTYRRSEGIYLHDTHSGETRRVDRDARGRFSSIDSFMPVISPDGNWVAYWSQRSHSPLCPPDLFGSECVDLFLYDRINETTEQVTIARPWDQVRWDHRMSLSTDGRWISLTIYARDGISSRLYGRGSGARQTAEAFVFDRRSGEFIPVNRASDGSPGDGASYAPNISADGRYVAFVSEAANLVADDTNNSSDIFVHDLLIGETERVSIASDGRQSDADSGLGKANLASWRDNVGLSADGRYVAFLSNSENLSPDEPATCLPFRASCVSFYVHDRLTGKTERLAASPGDRSYLFPTLSGNGQWAAHVELMADCSHLTPGQTCSEVWINNRRSGDVSRVMDSQVKYRFCQRILAVDHLTADWVQCGY